MIYDIQEKVFDDEIHIYPDNYYIQKAIKELKLDIKIDVDEVIDVSKELEIDVEIFHDRK